MSQPNPYRDWLGLPAEAIPPNYYQLLGLSPFESEPPVIADGADTQLERLRPHLAGPLAGEAQRLAADIEAVRDLLLQPAARQQYDAQLRAVAAGQAPRESVTMSPRAKAATPQPGLPPAAAAIPTAAVPMAAPVQAVMAQPVAAQPVMAQPVMVQPMMAQPMAAQPIMAQGAVAVGPELGVPQISRSTTKRANLASTRRREQTTGIVAVGLLGLAVVVLLGAVGYAFREDLGLVAKREAPRQVADQTTTVTVPAPPLDPRDRPKPPWESSRGSDGSSTAPLDSGMRDALGDVRPSDDSPAMSADSTPGMPASEVPTTPEPPPATTMEASTFTLPETTANPREMAEIRRLLAATRTALANRDLPRAAEQIDLAVLQATASDTVRLAGDGMAAVDAARNFWMAVVATAKSLAGNELTVNGQTVAVVEADDTKIVIRADGRNVEQPLSRVPLPVALALAEQSLSTDDEAGRLAVGTVLLIDTQGDAGRARELLSSAGELGPRLLELFAR